MTKASARLVNKSFHCPKRAAGAFSVSLRKELRRGSFVIYDNSVSVRFGSQPRLGKKSADKRNQKPSFHSAFGKFKAYTQNKYKPHLALPSISAASDSVRYETLSSGDCSATPTALRAVGVYRSRFLNLPHNTS